MGQPAANVPPSPDVEAETQRLLMEMNILADKADAIEAEIDARKERLRAICNDTGVRKLDSPFYGGAGYSPRRDFKVIDAKVLAKRLTKEMLAEGFKPTAALVDALAQKAISIDGMISIGVNETFAYTRPSTKEAKLRRSRIINECRKQYDQKVRDIVAAMASYNAPD